MLAQVKDWEPKISSIVDWFGQLQAVDVSGVPAAVHAREEGNVLRADAAAVYPNRCVALLLPTGCACGKQKAWGEGLTVWSLQFRPCCDESPLLAARALLPL